MDFKLGHYRIFADNIKNVPDDRLVAIYQAILSTAPVSAHEAPETA